MPAVVLVPGFGCSVLRDPARPSVKNTWLSLRRMATDVSGWTHDNRVHYDFATREYVSGCDMEAVDFGGHAGVRDIVPDLEWADEWLDVGQGYYGGLIDGLTEDADVTVLGAPYDFRTVLGVGFDEFRVRTKKLIEQQTSPVVIVAHSLGAVLVRAILSDRWFARRCVSALVEVCPAHGGSVMPLQTMVEGEFYVPVPSRADRGRLARMSRSMAGLCLTLPNSRAFPMDSPVMVDASGREYYSEAYPWPEVTEAWRHLAAPVLRSAVALPRSVRHVVLHGTKHDTPVMIDRERGLIRTQGGDGVITAASALSRTCDHTEIVHVDCLHRMAPSDAVTLRAVQKFL